MKHVMIDLETMGLSNAAAIMAIGACSFNHGVIDQGFYVVVDLNDSVKSGLEMDPGTVLWWMQQEQAAREEFKRKGETLASSLLSFTMWLQAQDEPSEKEAGKIDKPCIWGNGAAFDPVILENAYKLCGLNVPWSYHNVRCYRTMRAEFKYLVQTSPPIGVKHNALDDAVSQAQFLMDIWKALDAKIQP